MDDYNTVGYYLDPKRSNRHHWEVSMTMYGETWKRYCMTERAADAWIDAMTNQYRLETVTFEKVWLG